MKFKKLISGIFVSLLLANLALADTSTSYTIDLSELNSGGTLSSSSGYKVNSALLSLTDGVLGTSTSFNLGTGLIYLEQLCGNSILEFGESCDDGNTVSLDGCSSLCLLEGLCGNGVIDLGETCDDGNTVGSDGCSAVCAIESGYSCTGAPSTCSAVCGDGILISPEQCDDGNTVGGDGCNAVCAIEIALPPPPSGGGSGGGIMLSVCGNNKKEGLEQCDDGNKTDGDGCSKICRIEAPTTGKTLNIKARPGNRVNPTTNWGTTAYLTFWHHGQSKVVHTETVTINNTGWGQFTSGALPDGTYDVSIKALSHLTKPIKNIALTGNNTFELDFTFGETFYLIPGDVHESKDNFINALDITDTVEALYSANVHADLNKDGIVNALDISITVNNLYKTGE